MNNLRNIRINLGIDFGTSYTKVCYRFPGVEESGVVTFDGSDLQHATISSSVYKNYQNRLSMENERSDRVNQEFKFLKMRLAQLSKFQKKERIEVSSVSCWYLAKIIGMSRQWIEKREKDRLIGQRPVWSANIGIPVEHYDSPSVKYFKNVFAIAWQWSYNSVLPVDLDCIVDNYKQSSQSIKLEEVDCHPIPEITAAIQSFTTSRDSQPGIYVYFDIGAGTVDGVSFNYFPNSNGYAINCYAGKVDELGVEVLEAYKVQSKETLLRESVQKLVAKVVMAVIQKDPRGSLREQVNLPIFVGGGGANIQWYRKVISSTYEDFQHEFVKIPPYELKQVPKPSDLEMHGLSDSDFTRISVAYGLSIPAGTLTTTSLPKSVKPAPKEENPPGVVIPFNKPIYPNKERYDIP